MPAFSYAEDSVETAASVGWSNVDFEDEPTEAGPGSGVSIVFAGNRYYSMWSSGLADFYVSGGSRPNDGRRAGDRTPGGAQAESRRRMPEARTNPRTGAGGGARNDLEA